MDWKEEYRKKLVTAEQAAAMVKSGDYVVFTMGREAHAVGLAIAGRLGDLQGVKVFIPAPGYDFGWYDEGWQDSFKVTVMMPTVTSQSAIDARLVDFNFGAMIPMQEIYDAPLPDVLLTEVSAPDAHGYCSFGSSLWNKKRSIRRCREHGKLTIAEVNPSLIRTSGDNFIHVSEIDYFVEHRSTGGAPGMGSLAGRELKEPEPYLKNIAGYVNSLIRDGDTIQIGVGRTTEPLVKLGMLEGKRDLGYHSEATPPGIINLIQQGVMNCSRKTINRGKVVVTSIGGSTKEEMAWVNHNPMFDLVDVEYLEDIRVIAAHDNMVAINNTLNVDLTGQIASETIGHKIMAVAGGQIAFAYGALLSKGGRSITVMPSTAAGGKVSRITPALPSGTVVTIQRNCADYIITEYGVARMWGKSIRERCRELITIAHPDFRGELKKEAERLYGAW